jgi:hypothetical protein
MKISQKRFFKGPKWAKTLTDSNSLQFVPKFQ